jgi:hypothetical protein
MKLCPIAIVAGCAACPAVKVCPLKGVIGDWQPPQPPKAESPKHESPPARKPARGPGRPQ